MESNELGNTNSEINNGYVALSTEIIQDEPKPKSPRENNS